MSLEPQGEHEPWREATGKRDLASAEGVLSKERGNREEIPRPVSVPPSFSHQYPECVSHRNPSRNQSLCELG